MKIQQLVFSVSWVLRPILWEFHIPERIFLENQDLTESMERYLWSKKMPSDHRSVKIELGIQKSISVPNIWIKFFWGKVNCNRIIQRTRMALVKPECWQGVVVPHPLHTHTPPPQQEKILLTQQPAQLHALPVWCNSINHFRAWNTRFSFRVCKASWLCQPKTTVARLGCGFWSSRGTRSRGIQFGIVFLSEAMIGCTKNLFTNTRWPETKN